MSKKNRNGLLIAAAVLAAAVVTELRKPKSERTWQGKLLGLVPYDLRVPTLDRLARTYWNPDSSKVLVPQAFGVGWTVNAGAVAARLLH